MKNILIIPLSFFLFVACNKPDPEPEKKDPIYSDLLKEKGAADSALAAEEKTLAEHQKTLSEVKPQTGQIKYAQKRLYESEARINKLRQLSQYYEIRAESRKKFARRSYLKAFNAKESWPPPGEWEQYQTQKKLEQAPENWNVRARLEAAKDEFGLGNVQAPPKEGTEK